MNNETSERIFGFIPARAQSSRFPGKPLADILGKPMIIRVYERALNSELVDELFVVTDAREIHDAVVDAGGKAIMTKAEHPSGTDRIAEAAKKLDLSHHDIIVNIQGDQPLFEPKMIREVVTPLLDDPFIPMSTLIYKIIRDEEITHPNAVKTVFDINGFALYFSRATIPYSRTGEDCVSYYKHHGIYAYRNDFLQKFVTFPQTPLEHLEKLEQLRALERGYKIKVVVTEHDSIEVDTPEDLLRVCETYRKMI